MPQREQEGSGGGAHTMGLGFQTHGWAAVTAHPPEEPYPGSPQGFHIVLQAFSHSDPLPSPPALCLWSGAV